MRFQIIIRKGNENFECTNLKSEIRNQKLENKEEKVNFKTLIKLDLIIRFNETFLF